MTHSTRLNTTFTGPVATRGSNALGVSSVAAAGGSRSRRVQGSVFASI